MNDDVVVPEVTAVKDRDRWRIHCKFCSGPHFHRTLGWNEACCGGYTAYVPTGYILVDGKRFHPSKTVYLSRKL
jgi:hypothetical protein